MKQIITMKGGEGITRCEKCHKQLGTGLILTSQQKNFGKRRDNE